MQLPNREGLEVPWVRTWRMIDNEGEMLWRWFEREETTSDLLRRELEMCQPGVNDDIQGDL